MHAGGGLDRCDYIMVMWRPRWLQPAYSGCLPALLLLHTLIIHFLAFATS